MVLSDTVYNNKNINHTDSNLFGIIILVHHKQTQVNFNVHNQGECVLFLADVQKGRVKTAISYYRYGKLREYLCD